MENMILKENKMKNLEELENQYRKLGKEIEKLKNGNATRWEPKEYERYWYIDDSKDIYNSFWSEDEVDKWRKIINNIFKTEEEAKEYRDYLEAKSEYTYEFSQEEWEDADITKWALYYDYSRKQISITWCITKKYFEKLNFKTEEKAEEFLNKYKKQIEKFEFGIF